MLTEAGDLSTAAARLGDPLSGTLRIGVIPTVAPYLLPEVVPCLRARFPRLRLLWREDKTSSALAQGLAQGKLDVALVALEADLGEVASAVVAKDPFVLAAPAGHPFARGRCVQADELAGVDVLLLDDGHCVRDQVLSLCARATAHEVDFRATSLATLSQMVSGGAGVTLLPALSVPVEDRRGQLVVRRFVDPVPHRTIALVWRPRSPLGAALKEVADALRIAWPRGDETVPSVSAPPGRQA